MSHSTYTSAFSVASTFSIIRATSNGLANYLLEISKEFFKLFLQLIWDFSASAAIATIVTLAFTDITSAIIPEELVTISYHLVQSIISRICSNGVALRCERAPLGKLRYSPLNAFITYTGYLRTSCCVFVEVSRPTSTICVISYNLMKDDHDYMLTFSLGKGDDDFQPLHVTPPGDGKPSFTFAPLMPVHGVGCDPRSVLLDPSIIGAVQDIRTTAFVVRS